MNDVDRKYDLERQLAARDQRITELEVQVRENTAQAALVINPGCIEQPSHEDFMIWLSNYRDEFIAKSKQVDLLEAQLSKSQENVISDELNTFLHGAGSIDGLSFGDHVMQGRYKAHYWWRKLLPELKQ